LTIIEPLLLLLLLLLLQVHIEPVPGAGRSRISRSIAICVWRASMPVRAFFVLLHATTLIAWPLTRLFQRLLARHAVPTV
jgi:hypothetical protein